MVVFERQFRSKILTNYFSIYFNEILLAKLNYNKLFFHELNSILKYGVKCL